MRLRRRLTHRINRSIAWRVEDLVAGMREDIADLRHQLRGIGEHLDKRLGEIERRVDGVERESSWSANELARLAPQAAAFEARLEQQARAIVVTGPLEDLPEARLLLDVIREEHARVRARLSLVSAYEERLRRLEQQSASHADS